MVHAFNHGQVSPNQTKGSRHTSSLFLGGQTSWFQLVIEELLELSQNGLSLFSEELLRTHHFCISIFQVKCRNYSFSLSTRQPKRSILSHSFPFLPMTSGCGGRKGRERRPATARAPLREMSQEKAGGWLQLRQGRVSDGIGGPHVARLGPQEIHFPEQLTLILLFSCSREALYLFINYCL